MQDPTGTRHTLSKRPASALPARSGPARPYSAPIVHVPAPTRVPLPTAVVERVAEYLSASRVLGGPEGTSVLAQQLLDLAAEDKVMEVTMSPSVSGCGSVCVYVCVCVCMRERERENERIYLFTFLLLHLSICLVLSC